MVGSDRHPDPMLRCPIRAYAIRPDAAGGQFELVGQTGGYTFVGTGPRLVIWDISDLDNGQSVGEIGVPPGAIRDVAVAGPHAYPPSAPAVWR